VPLALDALAEAATEEAICEDLEACDAATELDAAACCEAEVEAAGGVDDETTAGILDWEETTTGGITAEELAGCSEEDGTTTTGGAVEVGGLDDGAAVEDGGTSEVTTTMDVLAGTTDEGSGVEEAIVAIVVGVIVVDIIEVVKGVEVDKMGEVVPGRIEELIVVVIIELLPALCRRRSGFASVASAISGVENRLKTGAKRLALLIIIQE